MATGRRPFEGTSSAGLTASILQKDAPSAVAMQPVLPHAFDRLVHRCLAKDPDERWQSARDLGFALRSIAGDATDARGAQPGGAEARWTRRLDRGRRGGSARGGRRGLGTDAGAAAGAGTPHAVHRAACAR
jgi:hypothetical protein